MWQVSLKILLQLLLAARAVDEGAVDLLGEVVLDPLFSHLGARSVCSRTTLAMALPSLPARASDSRGVEPAFEVDGLERRALHDIGVEHLHGGVHLLALNRLKHAQLHHDLLPIGGAGDVFRDDGELGHAGRKIDLRAARLGAFVLLFAARRRERGRKYEQGGTCLPCHPCLHGGGLRFGGIESSGQHTQRRAGREPRKGKIGGWRVPLPSFPFRREKRTRCAGFPIPRPGSEL